MIRFFNTLSGRLDDFQPLREGRVGLYTCGPTVYDYAHIGNYRAYMFEDLLKRFLLFKGFHVRHIMNITDVEDKIIIGANQRNVSIDEFTSAYIKAFHEDIAVLNILPADHYPRATRYVDKMAAMVGKLVEKGFAYEKDGSYYYDISQFGAYGKLSKIDMGERKIGVRIDSDEYEKESVHDFALWKAPKPGEFSWNSELGPGRPGWHIECSVMSMELLGDTIDIHCGGVDNIFPHHENEIAQSEAYTGKTFVKTWMHCQHLIRDGQKMSKSLGNTISLRELMETRDVSPMAIRLMLLSTHYRKSLNFTFDALTQAQAGLDRIRNFTYELAHHPFPEGRHPSASGLARNMRDKFESGLSDDLNISVSMTALFEMIKTANTLIVREEMHAEDARDLIAAVREIDMVLGVLHPSAAGDRDGKPQTARDADDITADLVIKLEDRETARRDRDFAKADRLRDELRAAGYIIEDTKHGPRLKKVEGG